MCWMNVYKSKERHEGITYLHSPSPIDIQRAVLPFVCNFHARKYFLIIINTSLENVVNKFCFHDIFLLNIWCYLYISRMCTILSRYQAREIWWCLFSVPLNLQSCRCLLWITLCPFSVCALANMVTCRVQLKEKWVSASYLNPVM